MIRLGFLGVGWIGRHRMAAMLATGRVEAAAIAEPDEAARAEALALAPGAELCRDLDALLALGLDGIVIATPSAFHAAQTVEALEAGAAVFCQKPLGRDAAETAAAVAAARRADRLLRVDLSYREATAFRRVRDLVSAGTLGRIHAADLVFHNAYGPNKPWARDRAQAGGGCLIDLGVHLVDFALWTLGWPEVADVSGALLAGGEPLQSGGVEDYAVATLRLADGAIVRLACSWHLPAGREAEIAATFYGREGAEVRNLQGSFYDFTANRLIGTRRDPLAEPPDDWGGRAAAAWANALADGARFDRQAERLVDVARVLDRIYAG